MERTPPHSIESEVSVLGAMMLDTRQQVTGEIRRILSAEDFYRPADQTIFQAICAMRDAGREVDLVAMKSYLADRGQLDAVGGVEYLVKAVEGTPDWHNGPFDANDLKLYSTRRRLIQFGQATAQRGYDSPNEDLAETLADAQQELWRLHRQLAQEDGASGSIQDSAGAVLARAKDISSGLPDPKPALPTGFREIDLAMGGGLRQAEVMILAADTGVGKTALATAIMGNACAAGGAALNVSAEMMKEAMAQRFLQCGSGVQGSRIRRGHLHEWEIKELEAQAARMASWKLHIVGRAMDVAEVAAEVRRLRVEWNAPVDLVVVDYLQIMKLPKVPSKAQQIADVARGLKNLALDLQTRLIVLSQLNREGKKGNRPPEKHDLKESGDIEDAADWILMLHKNEAISNSVQWAMRKARDGTVTPWCDQNVLAWDGLTTRFSDPEVCT